MELKPQGHQSRLDLIGEIPVRLISYELGDKYVCKIDNVDPGATIARAEGPNRIFAENAAIEKARRALSAF